MSIRMNPAFRVIAGRGPSRCAGFVFFLAALVAMPAGASSQCAFDSPARTRPMVLTFVRNFAACTTPDASYGSSYYDLGGCTSVSPAEPSGYRFGPDGGCTIKVKPAIVADCSTIEGYNGPLRAGPCQVTSFRGKCTGIERSGLPIGPGDDGWTLRAALRFTTEDPDDGDLTVQDPPFLGPPHIPYPSVPYDLDLQFGTPGKGAISLDRTIADASVCSLYSDGPEALPPCTSVQILSLEVVDPYGYSFAVPGFSTRPAGN